MQTNRRKLLGVAGAGALVAGATPGLALADGHGAIKIGMSMPQTGPLGAGGKAGLLALRMWVEDVNAKGGLLGRKVNFTYYDDQSNPANTPGIYTKLLDVDKVDLLIAPYATGPTAPIMPLVKQRNKLLMGNYSFQVNKVKHDMWFNNSPWNTADEWAKGFMAAGQAAGGKTVAILAEDLEFSQNLADGARPYFKKLGLKTVYDQNFPPTTKDFSSLVRAIRASKAEIVFIASYPASSAALVNSINEIGLGSQVKIVGGGMVGLQFTPIMVNLGSKLNGITNYHVYVPGMKLPGVEAFLKRYTERAKAEKIDELGFYLPPYNYAIGEMLAQAINATKSIDDRKLADYMHKNELQTIVGPVRFGPDGERSNTRLITVQFRGVKDKDQEQFRSPSKQVILAPASDKTGNFIAPFLKAKSAK
jgi:branched-chain amino acid transport system substrate-binding protein